VPHLPAAGAMPGTADLTLGAITIDTTALTIDGVAPTGGVTFDTWAQSPSGPGLAVLHVRALVVSTGATTRVVGARPLVVVAGGDVAINGVLDASAHGSGAGAGGAAPANGTGHGGNGIAGPANSDSDSGGGGAGFGTAGGPGCSTNRSGGAAGISY